MGPARSTRRRHFQPDEGHLEIACGTQGVHDIHQIAVGHFLVGANEHTLAAIILLYSGMSLAQTKTVEQIVALVNSDIILKSELDRDLVRLRDGLSKPAPQGAGLAGAQLEQA